MAKNFLDDMPDLGGGGRRRKIPAKKKADPEADLNFHEAVIWHVIRCPGCGSYLCPVHTTRRPIRYHKCSSCGANFKSVEILAPDGDAGPETAPDAPG